MRSGFDPDPSPSPSPRLPRWRDDPAHGPRRTEQAHEAHFLSRALRCQGADLERAMHLYHHSRVVRIVAEDLLKEHPAAERAAILLRDAPPCPRVIITRGGRFVTCLDETMACTDVPQLPYARFGEAIERVIERRAELRRQLAVLKRFKGRDLGRAMYEGPGRFHREMAEVFIEGGGFDQQLCDWLFGQLKLFHQYSGLHVRGLLDRRRAIYYSKIEGHVVLLCYLLAGVHSPGVAGILDYLCRHDSGFHEEFMLALSQQDDGDERLLAIASDRGMSAERRDAACAFAFASMTRHPERATAILDGVLALPPDPAMPRLVGLQQQARSMREQFGEELADLASAFAERSDPVRPAAPHWMFTGQELAEFVLAGRPALELFVPKDEGPAVHAAWDRWVRTRPIPPPPKQTPVVRAAPRVGRNEPCPCGSGRKHKQCCLGRPAGTEAPSAVAATAQPLAVAATAQPSAVAAPGP